MKLLIILSIEEFVNDVRNILAGHNIPAYSEMEVQGQKVDNANPDNMTSNWFAKTPTAVFSNLFFVIHTEQEIQSIMDEVEQYNQRNAESTNPLHAYQLDVDKAVG